MRLREPALALLFAAAYTLLFSKLVGYTATLDIPSWWYPTFGRTGASAIAWMQVAHSVGVLAAALPVAMAIAYFFPQKWLRMTLPAAILAMAVMLYDAIRGYYLTSQIDGIVLQPRHVVSSIIDVAKVGLLLPLCVWAFSRVVPSNNAFEPSA
jgi:hypothetical protein